jgi:hypothetical protein
MHFFIRLRFSAAFWAADSVPLGFNRYFLKRSMLFAKKLINRHSILLAEIFSENIIDFPIYIIGRLDGML